MKGLTAALPSSVTLAVVQAATVSNSDLIPLAISRGKTKIMKKWLKILLGLLSLWPFLYVMFFFVFMFYAFFFIPELGTTGSSPPKVLIAIIPIHILTMLLIIGLTLFYIVDVFRNNRVDKDKKALWAVVLFMGSMFAMPVYWYLYIWRDSVVDGSRGSSTLGSANASGYLKEVNAPNREHQYVPPAQPPNWRE